MTFSQRRALKHFPNSVFLSSDGSKAMLHQHSAPTTTTTHTLMSPRFLTLSPTPPSASFENHPGSAPLGNARPSWWHRTIVTSTETVAPSWIPAGSHSFKSPPETNSLSKSLHPRAKKTPAPSACRERSLPCPPLLPSLAIACADTICVYFMLCCDRQSATTI